MYAREKEKRSEVRKGEEKQREKINPRNSGGEPDNPDLMMMLMMKVTVMILTVTAVAITTRVVTRMTVVVTTMAITMTMASSP